MRDSRAAGERARFSGVFEGERLLGFIVTLDDGAQAIGYHIGFERAAAAQHPLYLRLLHASVADAIALGARELSLGRTALEPKARLGAKPVAMTVWARHRQPVFNKLAGRLLTLAHHDEAPECHPFKKAAGAAP
jgi:predicted anti-sigma-YlaC factor YlaD